MTEYDSNVVFSAGSPIDINKLNQLQRNISSIYAQNSSLTATTNQTVDALSGIQKTVKVFPIIHVGTVDITVDGEKTEGKDVNFAGTSFTANPTIVASISSDLGATSRLFVRATTKNSTSGRIEVVNAAKTRQTVSVNYIAVQMKVIE
jgi:hypothetical protein